MKNYFCFLILFLIFASKTAGQEVTIDKQSDATVLNDYELTDKQYAAWKSIQNNWLVGDYEAVLAENKIKLNCKSCNAFYLEVIIKINKEGKLEYYKLVNSKRCGVAVTKDVELRIMRRFFKFEYPYELRNTTFKTRLGNALKC
jgi:Pyruvate/2-oxoacid:ferredoxin oxidoreductase delta subunit